MHVTHPLSIQQVTLSHKTEKDYRFIQSICNRFKVFCGIFWIRISCSTENEFIFIVLCGSPTTFNHGSESMILSRVSL